MKRKEKHFTFNLELTYTEKLPQPRDLFSPHDLLISIEGKILAQDHKNEVYDILAGYLKLYILDIERAERFKKSIYEICDSSDSDLEGLASVFYEIHSNWLRDDLKIERFTNNALVIQYLLITDEFRGCGLGKRVIDSLVSQFKSRCDIIILHAVPQQLSTYAKKPRSEHSSTVFFQKKPFVTRMRYGKLVKTKRIAVKKLVSAWRNLGFKEYLSEKNGSFMYRSFEDV